MSETVRDELDSMVRDAWIDGYLRGNGTAVQYEHESRRAHAEGGAIAYADARFENERHPLALLASRLASLEAKLREQEWQPIESAPMVDDSRYVGNKYIGPTRIMLKFDENAVSVAYWDAFYAEGGDGYERRYGVHGAWIEPMSGERVVLHYDQPIGWRPLPSSPSETSHG